MLFEAPPRLVALLADLRGGRGRAGGPSWRGSSPSSTRRSGAGPWRSWRIIIPTVTPAGSSRSCWKGPGTPPPAPDRTDEARGRRRAAGRGAHPARGGPAADRDAWAVPQRRLPTGDRIAVMHACRRRRSCRVWSSPRRPPRRGRRRRSRRGAADDHRPAALRRRRRLVRQSLQPAQPARRRSARAPGSASRPRSGSSRSRDDDLWSVPYLYMTGHGNVRLERRRTSPRCGAISARAASSTPTTTTAWTHSIRRELARLFPGPAAGRGAAGPPDLSPGVRLPAGHSQDPRARQKPAQGFGIFLDGRLVVFYSYQTDLGDGWEDPEVHQDPPEKREAALRMGVNLFAYAVGYGG